MRKVSVLPLVALLGTAMLVPLACSKDPVVPGLTLDAGFNFGGAEGGAPAPVVTGYQNMDAGDPNAADAGAADAAAAVPSALPSAVASATVAAMDQALDVAMAALAGKDAPGMAPDGPPGRATLNPSGAFNMIVNLQPGKCYTVIAVSPPAQVTQLEVKLLLPPLYTMEAGRSPATDKNPAVLGKGAQKTCPISPLALPYRVDVTAKQGGGRMMVQVFSKPK